MKNASVLSLATSARSASDPLESRLDIEQRKFARNVSARFGAKGARIGDLARRDTMGQLREVVAPEPYAVARRQVVRGKMDLHSHPFGPGRAYFLDSTLSGKRAPETGAPPLLVTVARANHGFQSRYKKAALCWYPSAPPTISALPPTAEGNSELPGPNNASAAHRN